MKVLFDQNMPHNLKTFLAHHDVTTAAQMGWEELKNGDLLEAAENNGFDVFLTGDQNLSYQQNLAGRRIAIVELTKNNWPSVQPHVVQIVKAVDSCSPGAFFSIKCPYVYKPRNKTGR